MSRITEFAFLLSIMLSHIKANGITLQRHACYDVSSFPPEVTFFPVASTSQCAVLCFGNCVAIAVIDANNTLQCAVLSKCQIPTNETACHRWDLAVLFLDINFCETGVIVNGKCFILHNMDNTTDNQTEASQSCSDIGGQLPEVTSTADLQRIVDLAQTGSVNWTQRVWMGATWSDDVSGFVWPSGSDLDPYSALWSSGEPDGSGAEHCVAVNKQARLFDLKCSPYRSNNVVCAVADC